MKKELGYHGEPRSVWSYSSVGEVMVESKKRGLYVSLGFGVKAGSGHYNFVLDHLSSYTELQMVSCELRVASACSCFHAPLRG